MLLDALADQEKCLWSSVRLVWFVGWLVGRCFFLWWVFLVGFLGWFDFPGPV